MGFKVLAFLSALVAVASSAEVARQITSVETTSVPTRTTLSLVGSVLSTASTSSSVVTTQPPYMELVFDNIEPMITCEQGLITWNYFGPSFGVDLVVTNEGVSQIPGGSIDVPRAFSRVRRQVGLDLVTQPLTTDLNPAIDYWTWDLVDVPQGYYAIVAEIAGIVTMSNSFYVMNGSDTSCVQGSTTSPVSSVPTAAVGHRSNHVGAIVGGVVGGVLFVLATLAAVLLVCRRTRTRIVRRGGFNQAWANLKNKDDFAGAKWPRDVKHSRTGTAGSMSGMLPKRDDAPPSPTLAGSDEYVPGLAEKDGTPLSPLGRTHFIPSLPFDRNANPRTSISSSIHEAHVAVPPTAATASMVSLATVASVDPHRPQRHPSRSSVEFRTHRSSGSGPESPSSEMIPMSPSGSTRRAHRKAPPSYHSAALSNQHDDGVAQDEVAVADAENPFADTATADYTDLPQLNHKSSFPGGRPLHVIMPDMPSAQ